MNKQVMTISADKLKWCPFKFGFTARIEDVPMALKLQGFSENEVEAWDCLFGESIEPLSANAEVQVVSGEYETAILEAIKQMIYYPDYIQKVRGSVRCVFGYLDSNGNLEGCAIEIHCDPRPWEDEYLIDLRN